MQSAYDQAGRLHSLTYPDTTGAVSSGSETVVHTYDDSCRLRTVGGYATALTYDLDDQLTGTTYGNGVMTTIGRDSLRRWVDTIKVTSPIPSLGPPPWPMRRRSIYHATYIHDTDGRIRRLEESNPTP